MFENLVVPVSILLALIIIGVWIALIKNKDRRVYPQPTAEELRQSEIDALASLIEQYAIDPSDILKQQIADLEKKLGL